MRICRRAKELVGGEVDNSIVQVRRECWSTCLQQSLIFLLRASFRAVHSRLGQFGELAEGNEAQRVDEEEERGVVVLNSRPLLAMTAFCVLEALHIKHFKPGLCSQ